MTETAEASALGAALACFETVNASMVPVPLLLAVRDAVLSSRREGERIGLMRAVLHLNTESSTYCDETGSDMRDEAGAIARLADEL